MEKDSGFAKQILNPQKKKSEDKNKEFFSEFKVGGIYSCAERF